MGIINTAEWDAKMDFEKHGDMTYVASDIYYENLITGQKKNREDFATEELAELDKVDFFRRFLENN